MHGFAAALRSHIPLLPYPYRGERRACNLCGQLSATLLCRYDRRLKPLTTVRCDDCGLIRTDPMPSEEELARYYASAYRLDYQMARRRTPPKFHLRRSAAEAATRFALLSGLLRPRSRVLDLGSGSGEFLALVKQAGHDATGIEPGEDFARHAVARYGVRIEVASWRDADLPAGPFDLISAQHVLEHLRDPVDALRRMALWLADDGAIHVEVPNAEAQRPDPLQQFHFAHIHHFTPATLRLAAARAGLTLHPAVAPLGTTMIFRKAKTATELEGQRDVAPVRLVPDLAALTPFSYLRSGLWAGNALRRALRLVEGIRPKAGPAPSRAPARGRPEAADAV